MVRPGPLSPYPCRMYAKFFGLSQDPFSIAPDPRYLFMSERHREALAHLLYGLGSGGGFVLLSGEIGTGKTTVCRCFLEQIPANCNVAYIFNPKLSVSELLASICEEFHIPLLAPAATAKEFIDPLNQFLLREHASGKNNVLIIDEAQNLSAEVLEQLRLLTNLETNERKLLQIVLIGQPELRRMLARPDLEQLAQRVIARFHLDALSASETTHYITHRLAIAGMTGALPFDKKALLRIHQLSRGVPRRINLLCGRALLGAYANSTARVDHRMVDRAAAEVFGPKLKPQPGAGGAEGQSATGSTSHPWRTATLALMGLVGLLALAPWWASTTGLQNSMGFSAKDARPIQAPPVVSTAPEWAAFEPVAAASAALPSPAPSASAQASPTRPMLLSKDDFMARLETHTLTQDQAWQALGQVWGLSLDGPDPCKVALQQRVACFNSQQTPLSLIRELNRPGVLTLVDGRQRSTYAVLSALSKESATLRLGSQTLTVTLATLASSWRGDFATLRRLPEGYTEKALNGQAGPSAEWLSARLAQLPDADATSQPVSARKAPASAVKEPAARVRVSAFQLAHGLPPDGQVGPMTLMQFNRASGVQEPRLVAEKP